MSTPLLSSLQEKEKKNEYRFCVPGHKGKKTIQGSMFDIDFTELRDTGNLYMPDENSPIYEAEKLLAKDFKVPQAFMLTNGSTQGIFTMLLTACGFGGRLLCDRNVHSSVINAMAMLNIKPTFIYPGFYRQFNITAPVLAERVDNYLKNMVFDAVLITSPTYYGICSKIKEIAKITGKYAKPLLVDEAHGAHFAFMKGYKSAVALGADMAVCSMHKTTPALTQAAVLTANTRYTPEKIRIAAAMTGTSSPSYPIMASIDKARAVMKRKRPYLKQLAEQLEVLRTEINGRSVFKALIGDIDPLRLTVNFGFNVQEHIEYFNIIPEFCDDRNAVFIITVNDDEKSLEALSAAIKRLESVKDAFKIEHKDINFFSDEIFEETLTKAMFEEKETIKADKAVGRVCAEIIKSFPPSVPIILPGERITAKKADFIYKETISVLKIKKTY